MSTTQSIDFDEIITIVKETARLFCDDEAAAHITVKGRSDYVTEVDMTVQRVLYEKLAALYPDIQFMGEEKDNRAIDFDRPVWILDPVDGTTNLIHRFPVNCISLALAKHHETVAGVIYNPWHDELFFCTERARSPFERADHSRKHLRRTRGQPGFRWYLTVLSRAF